VKRAPIGRAGTDGAGGSFVRRLADLLAVRAKVGIDLRATGIKVGSRILSHAKHVCPLLVESSFFILMASHDQEM
jgi:hypothetical protein